MQIIKLSEATSTNSVAAEMGAEASHGTAVWALTQTAGRGQRGNTWEAEPGKNLTFSLVLRPYAIAAARQFELSMLVSIAIVRTFERYISDDVRIKWPNDIYVGDKKICGILIENSLSGAAIDRSIVGIGLNVNQQTFRSDAPNPVSMAQITGREYDLDNLINEFVGAIVDAVDEYSDNQEPAELQALYAQMLWRGDGCLYPWHNAATGEDFLAAIDHVDATGMLTLECADGTKNTFAFKEVAAVLK